MERRAKCRICDQVIEFTDVGSLGHHLITKHPNCSPNYFSVSEKNVKNASLNFSTDSNKSYQKTNNQECKSLVDSLSKILDLIDNKPEKPYTEKNQTNAYYASNYKILNASCGNCCSIADLPECKPKKKCSKFRKKKKASKTSVSKIYCEDTGVPCCCDPVEPQTFVESKESICRIPENENRPSIISIKCEPPPVKKCKKVFKTTVTSWKSGTKKIYCPRCKQCVTPIIKKTRNRMTRHSILSAFLLGCWPICFLCPMQFKRESAYYCCKCKCQINTENHPPY